MADYRVEKYIRTICDLLNIEIPQIVETGDVLDTDTMLAKADILNRKIYLSGKSKSMDFWFAIAHELRHIWQAQDDFDKWFGNYMQIENTDIETYNLQDAELDANAFAMIVMVDVFGVKPKFNGLSPRIVEKIANRADKIAENGIF